MDTETVQILGLVVSATKKIPKTSLRILQLSTGRLIFLSFLRIFLPHPHIPFTDIFFVTSIYKLRRVSPSFLLRNLSFKIFFHLV